MLTCAITERRFRGPLRGQGWFQAAQHRPGTMLQMKVVHPDEVRRGWKPKDWLGRGPEFGCCGIWEN